ncbi:hypothetical protein [Geitlerinema sp. PCC 9228]|uniref:hypothetical protein n=1 Tax=Geitlerinema sp. PCC 9228 TaxID=111611 RepID=UPI0008F9C31F|nr:hypothetical protein [Geitlerinema sp. PCC 9228]
MQLNGLPTSRKTAIPLWEETFMVEPTATRQTTENGQIDIRKAILVSPYTQPNLSQYINPHAAPTLVRLDLEDLKCFEVVEKQFQHWGVTLHNAIAIHPSNPAYPPHSGVTLLMGAPKGGFLEICFQYPVQLVCAFVTSSSRTVVKAYDQNDNLLAKTEIPQGNLAISGATVPANMEVNLQSAHIHRVTFQTFNGQLTVDDLTFGF